jgi:DNA-3-methyladenine glycosylase II
MHKRAQAAHIILSDDAMRKGIRALRRACPHLRLVHDHAGDPPLRQHTPGFEGLARIVVGQQLSLASAQAIWGRMQGAVQPMTPQAFLLMGDEELRAAGLSKGKVKTLRALSEAIAAGLDLDALASASDANVHEALTALPGIGPWTADIYLLMALGRPDIWPIGDLALATAMRRAKRLPDVPRSDQQLGSSRNVAPAACRRGENPVAFVPRGRALTGRTARPAGER